MYRGRPAGCAPPSCLHPTHSSSGAYACSSRSSKVDRSKRCWSWTFEQSLRGDELMVDVMVLGEHSKLSRPAGCVLLPPSLSAARGAVSSAPPPASSPAATAALIATLEYTRWASSCCCSQLANRTKSKVGFRDVTQSVEPAAVHLDDCGRRSTGLSGGGSGRAEAGRVGIARASLPVREACPFFFLARKLLAVNWLFVCMQVPPAGVPGGGGDSRVGV